MSGISVTNKAAAATFAQPSTHPIKIMDVDITQIHMAEYQRTPSQAKVMSIVREFSEHRVRPVELSYRDGAYWCFDGQHRVRAYQILNKRTIKAQVHYGLTYEEEAFLFAEQHRNETHISKRDEWKARMEAGNVDLETGHILHELEKLGFTVSATPVAGKRTIHAISEVQKIYRRHGAKGLQILATVINEAWPTEVKATHREIVSGIGKIMSTYTLSATQWSRLAERLGSKTPSEVLRLAKQELGKGEKRTAICFVKIYNAHLKSEKMRLDLFKLQV